MNFASSNNKPIIFRHNPNRIKKIKEQKEFEKHQKDIQRSQHIAAPFNPNNQTGGNPGFKKGQVGNPKGRPYGSYKTFMERIGMSIWPEIPRQHKYKLTEALLEMSTEDLRALADDEKSPIFLVAVAKAMVSELNKGSIMTINALFTRFFGAPKVPKEEDDGSKNPEINIINIHTYSTSDLYTYLDSLEKPTI